MQPIGIKPHTHAERTAVIEQLIPLWQQKFGDNLLGIAACASYGRGEDDLYSDLEMELFVRHLPEGEPAHYQRVVDGMLIEVLYRTPEQYLLERWQIPPHWHMSASDRLVPVYNAEFIEKLNRQVQSRRHSDADYLSAAAKERYELQECTAKVLNAIEQDNHEGISLVLMDATMRYCQVLALLNQQPFITFSRYISQARMFPIQPPRFGELLDMLVQGSYQDFAHLREVILAVFSGMEHIFSERGVTLYDDPFDPNVPAKAALPAGVHLVLVNRKNFRQCIKLPTGEDHIHVAPNTYSIAEAQFYPGTQSCCIYAGEELVGYVMYNLEFVAPDYHARLWISRLMMAENQRGKGYGRAVLQQLIAEARKLDCQDVALSTDPHNFKAIGLYESLGFHATEIEDEEMVYVLLLWLRSNPPQHDVPISGG